MMDTFTPGDPPRVVGRCRWCHREVWAGVGDALGYLRVIRDTDRCEQCHRWIRTHPEGADPRDARNTAAEVLAAERPEEDPSWREVARCVGVPIAELLPTPDESDPPAAMDRRYAAQRLCGPCPARARCRATADEHGYEGVWGGVMFERYRWHDLLSGERGDTIHALPVQEVSA